VKSYYDKDYKKAVTDASYTIRSYNSSKEELIIAQKGLSEL